MTHYHVVIYFNENSRLYTAEVPDLENCAAHGRSPGEAYDRVLIVKERILQKALREGRALPSPRYALAI